MSKLSITDFFKRLNAPLHNHVWSWGAPTPSGALVFRGWQDEYDFKRKRIWVYEAAYTDPSPGKPERLGHLQLIRQGAPCYVVVCQPDPTVGHERIKDYDSQGLFYGTELETDPDGNIYLRIQKRVRVDAVLIARLSAKP